MRHKFTVGRMVRFIITAIAIIFAISWFFIPGWTEVPGGAWILLGVVVLGVLAAFAHFTGILNDLGLIGNKREDVASSISFLHQLPSPPGDFVGRDWQIKILLQQFKSNTRAICVVHGMGGVGKTALALKLASQIVNEYRDAQIFLDMRGIEKQPVTSEEAMLHVVRSFYPACSRPEERSTLIGAYHSVLHDKKALLFFDNVKDANQIESLIPPRGCSLLLTSRQRLTLPNIYTLDLEVLSSSEAHTLLFNISKRLDIAQADKIAELCGYLPRSLKQAASTLQEKPNIEVKRYIKELSRVKTRVGLIEASVSQSYHLLGPKLKKIWRYLSVFPRDFDLPAAASVLSLDVSTIQEVLGELVRYSLLMYYENSARSKEAQFKGRYQLHDLDRLYADAQMNDSERCQIAFRHAQYYASRLSQANRRYLKGGDAIIDALSWFDLEWPNINAGQAWSQKNARKMVSATELCSAYINGGIWLLDLRLPKNILIQWLETDLKISRRKGDQSEIARALGNLGTAYSDLGRLELGISYLQQALEIDKARKNRKVEGYRLGNLGNAYRRKGELDKAIEYHQQTLRIAKELADLRFEAEALNNIGNVYIDLREFDRAKIYHKRALKVARENGHRLVEERSLIGLAADYQLRGNIFKSFFYFRSAMRIAQEIGDKNGEGFILLNIGTIYRRFGIKILARQYYDKSKTILDGYGTLYVDQALDILRQLN